jgi:hypothetical protein
MANGPQRTVLAQEAFKFNDVFGFKFSVLFFGAAVKRRLRLSEPEMSTDGGRKARQPIMLMPEEEGGRALVLGWIDVPRKIAELRSYNVASSQFEARYGSAIDIPREEWERAAAEVTGFLRIHQIETTVVDSGSKAAGPKKDEKPAVEKPADPSMSLAIAMLVIGTLIGFGLGYLVFGLKAMTSS